MTSTATLARALTLQNEGRVAEAVAMYRELLAREPLDEPCRGDRGGSSLSMGMRCISWALPWRDSGRRRRPCG